MAKKTFFDSHSSPSLPFLFFIPAHLFVPSLGCSSMPAANLVGVVAVAVAVVVADAASTAHELVGAKKRVHVPSTIRSFWGAGQCALSRSTRLQLSGRVFWCFLLGPPPPPKKNNPHLRFTCGRGRV